MTKPKRRSKGMTAKPTRRDYERFYQAAANLIRKSGGTALVAGGVTVIQFPDAREYNYIFGVRITGRKPTFSEELS